MQPWCTPFPIWNKSVVPCPVLPVASWPAYRFLKRQVRWSGIPISFRIFQFIVIHTVKVFGIVNKAEVDVFLGLSCLFNDPTDVGNLISGSSAFSKTSLNIWKFTAQVLLKPDLENFEHYFASMWDECNFEDILHFQGQGRSPKMALESNLIFARDAQRAQTNLVCTRTQRPHRVWASLCLSVSCRGTGQRWTVAGTGALSIAHPGMA